MRLQFTHNRTKALAFGLVAATSASILARGARLDWRSGDTTTLIAGLPGISRCLSAGVLTDCNGHGGQVSPFPASQMVPAYLLHEMRLGTGPVTHALALLNALAIVVFCGVVIRWCHGRGGLPLAVLGGLLLIPGMLIPYTAQTFGEPLAAVAFGGLCLATLRRDRTSWWIIPTAIVATVSKDTAAPFVLLFGLAGVALSGCSREVGRRSVIWLFAGTAVGLILVGAFNEFRYGTLTNHFYLDFPHSSKSMAINSFFGLLVSPNGGITWFWPGATVATVSLGVVLICGSRSALDQRRLRLGAAIALAGFFGSICASALWFQPYGWYAWGPRLLLPVVPAVVVLMLAIRSHKAISKYWLSAPATVALGLMALLAIAPSVGVIFDWPAYTAQIVETWQKHPECIPNAKSADIAAVQPLSERCIRFEAWETESLPLARAVPTDLSHHWWYWTTMLGGAGSIAIWAALGHRTAQFEQNGHAESRIRPRSHAAA